MTAKNWKTLLDSAAADRVPDSLDLTTKILSQIRSEKRTMMQPRMKLASTLLIVVLAVLAVTTIVYAVYRIAGGDPGLQAVQEAGLETNLNITAQATVLPTATPAAEPPLPVNLALSQTRAGVTLALDWIYLDETQMGLGMHSSELPQGLELDAPVVTFEGVTPMQPRGWTQRINSQTGQSEYASYQVIHARDMNGKLNVGVDVALRKAGGVALDTFHFELSDIPVYQPQNIALQQTYSVRMNAVEVRLEGVQVSETATQAILCYDDAVTGVGAASVSFDDGPETDLDSIQPLELNGASCARLSFPAGSAGNGQQMLLRVKELTVANGEALAGPWELYAGLPERSAYNQAASPQPTAQAFGEQTLENVTVSLDWFFVDAKRAAVGYTIRGLPNVPDATSLLGAITLSDASGQPVSNGWESSSVERVAGEPGMIRGTFSAKLQQPLTEPEATFSLDITLDGSQTDYAIGYFAAAPEATPWPSGVFPPALPDRLVGTYHFEFAAQVHPMTTVEDTLPVTAGDVEISIPYAEMTASATEVMVCYNKPTASDWWVWRADLADAYSGVAMMEGGSLLFDVDYQVPSHEGGKWSVPEAIQTAEHGRCLQLEFPIGHAGRPGPFTLTIDRLEISPPEVIPDDQIVAAQDALRKEGIEMNYYWMTNGNGGASGPRFTTLPEGMSFEEAFQRFMDVLGYIQPGPWEFTLNVTP